MTTTPPTFTPSTAGAAADMNLIRDAILELQLRADGTDYLAVKVLRTTNQSIPNNTDTAVSFNVQSSDLGAWWSSGTDIIVPVAAIPAGSTTIAVRMFGKVAFAANSVQSRRLQFLRNGVVFGTFTRAAESSGTTPIFNMDVDTDCEAGDVLTVEVFQNSGGALNCTAVITAERAGVTG